MLSTWLLLHKAVVEVAEAAVAVVDARSNEEEEFGPDADV